MKTLFRILIVISALAIIYYYSSDSIDEYEPLEGPNSSSPLIPKTGEQLQNFEQGLPRPEKGLSIWIDKKSSELEKQYGEPDRIDQTAFGYEWWVYNAKRSKFVMFGVEDGIVSQVYISGQELDASPYHIGQNLDEIYRMTIVDTEVTATIEENIYTFSMNEEDMRTRILTKFDGLFTQLYIDSENETLNGIRFMNSKTLVVHKPYEMTFAGELITAPSPTSYLLEESNLGSANQLFDLINSFRIQHGVPELISNEELTNSARSHSEEMYTKNYLSHDSPSNGSLKERLDAQGISYDEVGENLASAYFDSIEAVHGWLNSKDHREVMLDEKYTHVGSGVFMNYYTQILINEKERMGDKQSELKDLEE